MWIEHGMVFIADFIRITIPKPKLIYCSAAIYCVDDKHEEV